jgi:hypothetical protein
MEIVDPVCLAMSETFEALDSIHRLIQQLCGLFLSFGMMFVLPIQLPEARLRVTELKVTYHQSKVPFRDW